MSNNFKTFLKIVAIVIFVGFPLLHWVNEMIVDSYKQKECAVSKKIYIPYQGESPDIYAYSFGKKCFDGLSLEDTRDLLSQDKIIREEMEEPEAEKNLNTWSDYSNMAGEITVCDTDDLLCYEPKSRLKAYCSLGHYANYEEFKMCEELK